MGIPDFTVETNVVSVGSGKKKVLECTVRSFLTTMTFRVTASVGELLSFEKFSTRGGNSDEGQKYSAATAGGNFTIALNKNLTVNVRGNTATLIRGSTGFDLVIRMEWCHTVDLARSLYAAAKSNDDRVGREKAKPKVSSKGKAPETESDSDSDEAPEPKLDTKPEAQKSKSPESDSESEEEGFDHLAPREGIKAIFKTLNGCGTSTGYILAYPESTLSAAGGVVVQPQQVILSYTREDALATFPYGNTTGPYAPLKCTAHYKSERILIDSITVLNVSLADYSFKAVLGRADYESDCGTIIAMFEIVDSAKIAPSRVAAPKGAPKPPAKKGAPKNKPAPKASTPVAGPFRPKGGWVESEASGTIHTRLDIKSIFDQAVHSASTVLCHCADKSVDEFIKTYAGGIAIYCGGDKIKWDPYGYTRPQVVHCIVVWSPAFTAEIEGVLLHLKGLLGSAYRVNYVLGNYGTCRNGELFILGFSIMHCSFETPIGWTGNAAPSTTNVPKAETTKVPKAETPKVEDDVNQALIIRGDIYNIFDTYSHSTGPVVAYPELPSVNSVPNFLPHQVLLTYSATTATETFTGAGPYSRLRCRAYYTSRDALVKGIAELNTKLADYKSGRFKAVVAGFGGDDWASFEVRDLKP